MADGSNTNPVPAPLKVELGVPMRPGIANRGPVMVAMQELAAAPVGASVLFPPEMVKNNSQLNERAYRIGGKGWVTIRKADGGHWVWKIAEPRPR